MYEILLDVPVKASPADVFKAVSTSEGLNHWWTEFSTGEPKVGAIYELRFGEDYIWRAEVTRYVPDSEFEVRMTEADTDWIGTIVSFRLQPVGNLTWVRFSHVGWPVRNEHYRISCNCWALYLRILRRHLEYGEMVPYDARLAA